MANGSLGSGFTPREGGAPPSSSSPRLRGLPIPGSQVASLPRLPFLLRFLAVLSLCLGVWGAMSALTDVNRSLLLDRSVFVVRVKDRQLLLFDQAKTRPESQSPVLRPLIDPFLKLPRAEFERLSLLLGDALYDRRGVSLPLGVLQLLLCWLLLSGSLATLRRQPTGVSTWSWACWANIPFALLNMLVTFVHSRTLMSRLGGTAADALSQVTGRGRDVELSTLWQLTRLFVMSQAFMEGRGVLFLGLTALYLQRFRPSERERDRER
jgi:hypothetical protein